MKTKKFKQKLSLNKITQADLNIGELERLLGGGLYTDDDPTCYYITCSCPGYCCTGNPCRSK